VSGGGKVGMRERVVVCGGGDSKGVIVMGALNSAC
jgi:hypothetical protein